MRIVVAVFHRLARPMMERRSDVPCPSRDSVRGTLKLGRIAVKDMLCFVLGGDWPGRVASKTRRGSARDVPR